MNRRPPVRGWGQKNSVPRGRLKCLQTGARLVTAAALLTAAGTFLVYTGLGGKSSSETMEGQRPRPARSSQTEPTTPQSAATPQSQPTGPVRSSPQPQVLQSPPGRTPAPSASGHNALQPSPSGPAELPPPDSGPAADPLIQHALDQASTPDLPPATEQQVLALARTAWLAETAGYAQVRIQAATARRDTPPPTGAPADVVRQEVERVVVRLVWAGADPAGTFLDGRPATVRFTQNGDGSWKRIL